MSSLFHVWMMGYEFSDTAIAFTRNKVVFLTSAKKQQILDKVEKPEGYEGVDFEVVEKEGNGKDKMTLYENFK